MSIPHITDAEEIVLGALWGHESSTLGDIALRLQGQEWSPKTIKSLIARLCDKGAVGIERWGRRHRYLALIEKENFAEREARGLAERLFGGSPGEMMAFFCRTQELTPEEAAELMKILEQRRDVP